MSIKINNRRYLGNKYKLLSFIKEVVDSECKDVKSIFDVFSGTGAVASAFIDKVIISNDILYSNYLSHVTWFSPLEYSYEKIERMIDEYNEIKDIKEENYMSLNFSNTFFSHNICKKIGYIRDDIENKYNLNKINDKERAILITSLLYGMDKIANTCGHYDAYRKNSEYNNNFRLEMPEMSKNISKDNKCYNMDSNILAKNVECDLAYLDPPYNSRQYCDAYHLLENVAKWEKPVVSGVAKKMDRTSIKSEYCTINAGKALEELVESLNCKYILLSYNNTGDNANDRSNAKISDAEIMRILENKGKVKIFSKCHKAFTTGKSENNNNEERLFLCFVNKAKDKKAFSYNTKDVKYLSSPLNYTGGKGKLLPQMKPLFPQKINIFVDLFCGGCNVGINVNAKQYFYNDNNSELIGLYKTFMRLDSKDIIDNIENIIDLYKLSNSSINGYSFYKCDSSSGLGKYNKKYFNRLREDFNKLNYKNTEYYMKFYALIVYGFNNQIRFNSDGKYNLPVGKRDFNKNVRKKLISFIDVLKNQRANFTNKDFRKFEIGDLDSDSFVYADPPYLITTASYNEGNAWNERDEKDLLEFLDDLDKNEIKFALSNVIEHKGKINYILKNWIEKNKDKYIVNHLNYSYSNSNYHAKNKTSITDEVLITNYKEG